jgi:hypothetical protein
MTLTLHHWVSSVYRRPGLSPWPVGETREVSEGVGSYLVETFGGYFVVVPSDPIGEGLSLDGGAASVVAAIKGSSLTPDVR